MMNSKSHLFTAGAAFLLLSFAAACGGSSGGGPAPVNLKTAANYVILAKTGITNVPTSDITGNLGVSPISYTAITGFALTPTVPDAATVFSTSAQVTGKVYAADYLGGTTASDLSTAVTDMGTAFTDAAGRAADVTELGAGNIGGKSLAAGVYKWTTAVTIPTDVTLHGGSSDVWIFQIAQTLTMASATHVNLSGGALAKNVFWQVSGGVTIGTTAQFKGIVLGQTAITLGNGASVDGRLLAQAAVNLNSNVVTEPAP
jgi:hypothetical protein